MQGALTGPDQPEIAVTPNGPYVLSGDVEIRAADGTLIRRTGPVALCRCGASASKPFCDESHLAIGFTDPADRGT